MGQSSETRVWVTPPPPFGRNLDGQPEPRLDSEAKLHATVYKVWIQLFLMFKRILFFTSKTVIWPLMQHRLKRKNNFFLLK